MTHWCKLIASIQEECLVTPCTGSCGMRVLGRWSQYLDKASASITSPRAIWSRYSLVWSILYFVVPPCAHAFGVSFPQIVDDFFYSLRRLHTSSLISTYRCSIYHPRSYAVSSTWNYGSVCFLESVWCNLLACVFWGIGYSRYWTDKSYNCAQSVELCNSGRSWFRWSLCSNYAATRSWCKSA